MSEIPPCKQVRQRRRTSEYYITFTNYAKPSISPIQIPRPDFISEKLPSSQLPEKTRKRQVKPEICLVVFILFDTILDNFIEDEDGLRLTATGCVFQNLLPRKRILNRGTQLEPPGDVLTCCGLGSVLMKRWSCRKVSLLGNEQVVDPATPGERPSPPSDTKLKLSV
jgi:hypothetical protein